MPRPCPHNILRFYQKNVYYCQKCFMPFAISMTDHPSHEEMIKLKGGWDQMQQEAHEQLQERAADWGFVDENFVRYESVDANELTNATLAVDLPHIQSSSSEEE